MTGAKATIDNVGEVTMTFTDRRTGPCNAKAYVIRSGDTVWANMTGARDQNNVVTISFKRDIVSGKEYELTIAANNDSDESQPSAAVFT